MGKSLPTGRFGSGFSIRHKQFMSRLAIIDLGTNTFNLLIVESSENATYRILFSDKLAVKLGQGGIDKKQIAPEPFQRGVDAIKQCVKVANEHKAERVFAFGTSAIRSAANGKDFVKIVRTETGVDVKVIDGNTEAHYIYYGVKQALKLGTGTSLIMDIGGGSTEFILCNESEVFWKASFDLGVTRLMEKFNPGDPLSLDDVLKFEAYFNEQLKPLFQAVKEHPTDVLIGSSGSFDSFAEMIAWQMHNPLVLEGKTGYEFDLHEFYRLHQYLLVSTLQERLQMKGLIQMRADTIALAGVFVNYILQKLHINRMRLSTYALKEGVVSLLLNGEL